MTNEQQEQQLDRKDLKILAYKEKVGELEERVADYRVDITILQSQLNDAQKKINEFEESQRATQAAKPAELPAE